MSALRISRPGIAGTVLIDQGPANGTPKYRRGYAYEPGELVVGKSSAPRERDADKENARKRARRAQEKAWYEANKDRVMERQRQRRAARKAA